MLYSGLLSITFRQLSAKEVIDLTVQAGLDSLEWGGDVHVPHGNVALAKEIRQMAEDAGLALSAYGSYYRVGVSETDGLPFSDVLASGVALGVPTIRVWAGQKNAEDADGDYRTQVIADARRIADMAAAENITISYEYHGGTLTNTDDAALAFFQEVDHPNLRTFWQPHNHTNHETRVAGLKEVLPWLSNVHIFYWQDYNTRYPLADGESIWLDFLPIVKSTGRDHYVSMEFVQDNDPQNFLRDAAVLKQWLAQVNGVEK